MKKKGISNLPSRLISFPNYVLFLQNIYPSEASLGSKKKKKKKKSKIKINNFVSLKETN